MDLETIAKAWIDHLARLWLGWRDRRRARNWLKLRQDDDDLIVRQSDGTQQTWPGALSPGAALPGELARSAQRAFVMLELGSEEIVSRRMSVPAQARELLPGIVRNQIERLSPWRATQACYGFDVQDSAEPNHLDVRVLITPRAVVDDARHRMAALGLHVDAVVAGGASAGAANGITLWSRLADADGTRLIRLRWIIGGAMAAAVGLAVVLNVWAFMAAAAADAESGEIVAEIARLQRQVKGTYSPQSIASLPAAERAWALKETSLVSAIVIEALSRVLPDSAYLTELNIDGSTVRIAGIATDAPALIAPLEQSGQFKDVHFYAPTTRSADGARFIFHIEARVEPHPTMAGG
ncbi:MULTISPECIES: PilN domain-containing protein [unclassified Bradyrhizobium]|uniref:PilN domain-containing protein n=1 Tax=unclassified Bradyrhizobium TaxID=2631580 RepID=UPI0028E2252D|nr:MULTISPECIES: PilN domain-containing protein [unclassified Bradyrhizobium]